LTTEAGTSSSSSQTSNDIPSERSSGFMGKARRRCLGLWRKLFPGERQR
jgi:hypothetical protein